MTDEEAIMIAKRYGLPIVHIPPFGVIDEITTVDLRDRNKPVVTRTPSSDFGPGRFTTGDKAGGENG